MTKCNKAQSLAFALITRFSSRFSSNSEAKAKKSEKKTFPSYYIHTVIYSNHNFSNINLLITAKWEVFVKRIYCYKCIY